MAFSQTQLDTLEAAIARGITTVESNGRRVTYQSIDEMVRLRDSMRAELGVSSPTGSRSRIINLSTGKGL